MTDEQFIATIREAQKQGKSALLAELTEPFRGVKRIVLHNLDGAINGNRHDIWIGSRSYKTGLGRAYLGSRRSPRDLEGWPERIEVIG